MIIKIPCNLINISLDLNNHTWSAAMFATMYMILTIEPWILLSLSLSLDWPLHMLSHKSTTALHLWQNHGVRMNVSGGEYSSFCISSVLMSSVEQQYSRPHLFLTKKPLLFSHCDVYWSPLSGGSSRKSLWSSREDERRWEVEIRWGMEKDAEVKD